MERRMMNNVSDCSTGSSGINLKLSLFVPKQSNLRAFTFLELKAATKDFSTSLIIREDGFGFVYKGVIQSTGHPRKKIHVAVKRLLKESLQGQLKEFLTEVNILGVAEHQNLVKLVGCCAMDDELLLVYEYMPNRSVLHHLSSQSERTLPWGTRLKIAQDAARGLAYLHEGMEFQVIWRDFKSSNLLLDEQCNVKLSDFGLAWLGPTDKLCELFTMVVGCYGYADPEYIHTGRFTTKSDVWSYGVFLCELITGRRAVDRSRPEKEQVLVDWVRPHLNHVKKLALILDPKLKVEHSLNSVKELVTVANLCLAQSAISRPKMSEVLEMVNRIVETTESFTPIKSLPNETSQGKPFKRRFMDRIIREKRPLAKQK